MAEEEERTLTEGTEGETATEEAATAEEQQQEERQSEPGPVETLAAEMGWVPKDQFRGDESEWRDAPDFIKAGRDITRTVSRQLKNVQEQLGRVTSTSSQLMADKLAERDAYWHGIQAKAVEEGDNDTVNRAVDERLKLKAAQPTSAGLPPETTDFMEKHKAWMGVDPLATMRAETLAEELAKRGVPPAEQLRQVERAIRKEYPEHFAPPAKPPAGVQTSRSRNTSGGSGKKGFADMPAESQNMARDYLKRHGIPLETTAESYWADNEKNERKVG